METVHGYWKKEVRIVRSGIWGLTAYCSVCNRLYPKVDHTCNIERFDFPPGLDTESFAVKTVLRWTENRKLVPYCCHCGAKMDGEIGEG